MVSSEGWLWIFRAGVGFLLLAALLFLLGFATDHWHDNDIVHYGLWNSCDGAECSELESDELPAYHIATQAFQTLAAIFFALSPIIHLFVYCCKQRKDTGWRSRILDIGYSSGILFHLCSVLIFGLENSTPEHISWSYRMSCASSAIAFFGILMISMSRSKALHKFTFRSVNRNKRKTAATTVASSDTSSTDRRFSHNSSRLDPFHPQEKIIISSTSDQSHSMRVPDTNVNINISINAGPSNNNNDNVPPSQPLSHQSSSSSPTAYAQPFPGSPSRLPPIVPESQQRLHPSPSETFDHSLTQVRSAPKSSIAPYTSPTHRNTFGPADRRRTLELLDNSNISNSSTGSKTLLPSISGQMPTAPPYEENYAETYIRPPSYSDAVGNS